MSPDEQAKRERDMEQVRQELYRSSRNIHRVYNPLSKNVNYSQSHPKATFVRNGDFTFYEDGYPHVIKSGQTKDIEKHLVDRYIKAFCNFRIGQMQMEKGKELLDRRKAQGDPDFLDKYVEEMNIWDKVPRLDDENLIAEITDKIYLGLVEEYGLEITDPGTAPFTQQADQRSVHERVLAGLSKRIASEDTAPKADLLAEVTVND